MTGRVWTCHKSPRTAPGSPQHLFLIDHIVRIGHFARISAPRRSPSPRHTGIVHSLDKQSNNGTCDSVLARSVRLKQRNDTRMMGTNKSFLELYTIKEKIPDYVLPQRPARDCFINFRHDAHGLRQRRRNLEIVADIFVIKLATFAIFEPLFMT